VGTQVVAEDVTARDAAATVLVHPKILETLFLLLQVGWFPLRTARRSVFLGIVYRFCFK
jgi:hypothetical protein